jgi:hypothetical protein
MDHLHFFQGDQSSVDHFIQHRQEPIIASDSKGSLDFVTLRSGDNLNKSKPIPAPMSIIEACA